MKKGIFLAIYVLLVYCFFLVWTFPADRACRLLWNHYPILAEKVALSQVEGTVWRGRAGVARIEGIELNNLTWSIRRAAFLRGRLQVFLRCQVPDGSLHGTISAGLKEIAVKQCNIQLTAAFFDAQTQPLGVKLSGSFSANISEIAVREGRIIRAGGTVVWSGAQVVEPQRVKLGDLKAQWSTGESGEVLGVLSDGGGPLQAQGTFKLQPAGEYEFTGSFRARDRTQPALTETLQLLGRPGKDGAVRATLSGRLPVIGIKKQEDNRQGKGEEEHEK